MATYAFNVLSPEYTELTTTISGSAVVKGEFVTLNEVNGFYMTDVAIGSQATVVVQARKVEVDKTTGETWAEGEAIYYVAGTGKCSNVAGANVLVGYAYRAGASADTEGFIIFDGKAAFEKL